MLVWNISVILAVQNCPVNEKSVSYVTSLNKKLSTMKFN